MRRSGSILVLLVVPLLGAGCAGYAAYEGHYVHDAVYEDAHHDGRYHRLVERDARGYVRHLDPYLHLNRRQEQSLRRLLADRTYALLDRHDPSVHHRVYPFPRSYGHTTHRVSRRWWHETDRHVEHYLSRRQIREYRTLTRRDYYDDGYDRRYKRYDDDDDD